MRSTVILEKGRNGWGAQIPDLPGCAVIAQTEERAAALIREAILLYLDDLRTKHCGLRNPLAMLPRSRFA
jgi:predicted RNase H-like HicB family nuclease